MDQEFNLEAFDELLSETPKRRRHIARSRILAAKRLAALRRRMASPRWSGRPFPPRRRLRPGWPPKTVPVGGGGSFGAASFSGAPPPIEQDPGPGAFDSDDGQSLTVQPGGPNGIEGSEPNEPPAAPDDAEFLWEFGAWPGEFGHEMFEFGESEVRQDPSLMALAEQIVARSPIGRSAMEYEGGKKTRTRITVCFGAADVDRVRKTYQDNATAAAGNSVNRCSCIVMLNVALGQLLKLQTKNSRARSTSSRIVKMGALTTETIEKAMAQLVRAGLARRATPIQFLDSRNKRAGTLKPVKLQRSVQQAVLAMSPTKGCWYAFGLSIMDGYHSVLLLVDKTGTEGKIYWLDQFSSDINDDVTTTLDARITTKTQNFWQGVKDTKNVGYNTTVRIWPLRHRVP